MVEQETVQDEDEDADDFQRSEMFLDSLEPTVLKEKCDTSVCVNYNLQCINMKSR